MLGFVNQNGITGSYNAATGVLTLTGTATVAQYQAALACYHSAEYQAAAALRRGKAEVDLVAVQGYDGPQT